MIRNILSKRTKETTMNTYTKEITEFIDYVYSFYNEEDGIYPISNLKVEHIYQANLVYQLSLLQPDNGDTWGGGDSLDRERVRDILLENKELNLK